uniref:Uncharacterized protein n=1 Tax=Moschus moschiferus TaxID=68415 RepID=A0A8C6FXM2_MOSMO
MAAALARLGLRSVKQVRVQQLRALRGLAVRRWASLDYARRSPDRPGNAHCFHLSHPGQGHSGERGQAELFLGREKMGGVRTN